MRKEIKGVGMTVQEIEIPETVEEHKAAMKALSAAWKAKGTGFEVVVTPIEEWALYQLAAFGFEDLKALRTKDPILGDSLGDRALHYAAMVLKYIDIVRTRIADSKDPDVTQEAARFGVKLGELFAQIQTTLEWEQFAMRGKAIAESKRGMTPLYRAADLLLKENPKLTAKQVRNTLEKADVIIKSNSTKSDALRWKDDHGVSHRTKAHQFESRISALRKHYR